MERRAAVLISPCILSPGFQTSPKLGRHWGYPFILLLMQYGVDIIPLPCSESMFGGLNVGLRRKPHGVKYYETLNGYIEHCEKLASDVVKQMVQMRAGGYQFLCILGVENSPSCAVNHIYSNKGTLTRKGVFFHLLENELLRSHFNIQFIGILRRSNSPSAYTKLERLLKDWSRTKKGDNS